MMCADFGGDEVLAKAAYNRHRAAMLKVEHDGLRLLRTQEKEELKRAIDEQETKENKAQELLVQWSWLRFYDGRPLPSQPSLKKIEEKQEEVAQWIKKAETSPDFKLHSKIPQIFGHLTELRALHAQHVAILYNSPNLRGVSEATKACQSLRGVTFADLDYRQLYNLKFRKFTLPILIGTFLVLCVPISLLIRSNVAKIEREEEDFKAGISAFESKNYLEALNRMAPLTGSQKVDAKAKFIEIYLEGMAKDAELKKNFEWHQIAASMGLQEAQFALGIAYRDGIGTDKDAAKAKDCFLKAGFITLVSETLFSDGAKRYNSSWGHAGAQLQLGLFFRDGTGVAPDPTEAYQWFKLAAINGLPEAQFYLGRCYELGFGVEKNSTEALSWYKKAADGGFFEAKEKLRGKL